MLDLPDAIQTAFAANSTLAAAFPGTGATNLGYRWGEAPASLPAPFVIARGIAAPRTFAYGSTKDHSENTVEFAVVAAGLNAARVSMQTFVTAWDAITITLDNGTCYGFFRDTDPVPDQEPEGQDEQGRDVWVWRVTYSYFIQP